MFVCFYNVGSVQLALSGESYDYIRITPYFDELDSVLSETDAGYIKLLVSAAIRYFESTIKVVPIDGTFYLPRGCQRFSVVNGYINCFAFYPDICGVGML